MKLDVRIPVGLLFSALGVILAAFGGATNGNASLYGKSLGMNVNLWIGVAMLIFGQAMFKLGRRSQKQLTLPADVRSTRRTPRRKR